MREFTSKAAALAAVSDAHARKVQADKDLDAAITAARYFGASNGGIASRMDQSEAAVRMRLKRRQK